MKKKKLIMILTIFAILAIGGFVFYRIITGHTQLNDDYVAGNSAGNLYNSGLFCENEGVIFFSNPNDKRRLYRMNKDGSELKKLSDDSVSSINVDEHYVYYTRCNENSSSDGAFGFLNINANSLCRVNKNGKHPMVLDSDYCMNATLCGNYVYYIRQDEDTLQCTLYSIKIDGTEKKEVVKDPVETASVAGQYIYYGGLNNDNYIHLLNTADNSNSIFYKGYCYHPLYYDGTIYYMNAQDDYSLYSIDPVSLETTKLTQDRVDCFSVYGSYVYYQSNTRTGLYKYDLDNGSEELIASGNYSDINITSSYIYFRIFGDNSTIYQTPTNSLTDITIFAP